MALDLQHQVRASLDLEPAPVRVHVQVQNLKIVLALVLAFDPDHPSVDLDFASDLPGLKTLEVPKAKISLRLTAIALVGVDMIQNVVDQNVMIRAPLHSHFLRVDCAEGHSYVAVVAHGCDGGQD